MIKISHESPLSIFNKVEELTDYSYSLVHLFEENEEYFSKFADAVNSGREVILDNSIFELGEAFDADRFAYWIEKLQPSYYIVPDVLEDMQGTIDNFNDWKQTKSHLPGKTIGVVQGETYEEIVLCYKHLIDKVDKIAISFDYSFFEKIWYPNEPTKYHSWVRGRQKLLEMMLDDGVIDTQVPHHLLGTGLPQEGLAYKDYDWIDSVDTSNPIVAGMKGLRYDSIRGLQTKPSQKLFTLINSQVTVEQQRIIDYNIEYFRKIWRG